MNSRNLLWISLFTALTAVSSWVRIPFAPVPFTLQTLLVYLSGSLLGPVRGMISQIFYLMIGLIGAPVFSGGGGPAYVIHPTFGYLLGFPAAAALTGYLMRTPLKSAWSIWMYHLSGMAAVHGLGLVYLAAYFKWIAPKSIAFTHLIWTGSAIFLPGEILKIGLAIFLYKRLCPYMPFKEYV